jgi:hypothetical protein
VIGLNLLPTLHVNVCTGPGKRLKSLDRPLYLVPKVGVSCHGQQIPPQPSSCFDRQHIHMPASPYESITCTSVAHSLPSRGSLLAPLLEDQQICCAIQTPCICQGCMLSAHVTAARIGLLLGLLLPGSSALSIDVDLDPESKWVHCIDDGRLNVRWSLHGSGKLHSGLQLPYQAEVLYTHTQPVEQGQLNSLSGLQICSLGS